MDSLPRLCVVGSANVDLTFCTSRLPQPGETVSGHTFHQGLGGKGANQAVAAARLGAQVTLIARVGNDSFGQDSLRRYRAEGIDTSFIQQDADRPTGMAAILVDGQAENCIVVVAGANAGLSVADVNRASAVLQKADGVLCQLETPLATTLAAFRLARAAGVRTVLTPAPATELPDELYRLCDLCVPNRTELELLTGQKIESDHDAEIGARWLRERGVGTVVVTLGSRGSLLWEEAGGTFIRARQVEAVDPTGAGDAFTAALAVALAEGRSCRDAGRWASGVAAVTVTRLGTQTAFPTRAEVE